VELLLTLDRRGGAGAVPLHTQLERQLRERIRAGRLEHGTRLPATRELAQRLGVSRGVVVEAYAQLTAEGYLTTRRGGGTLVAAAARTTRPPAPAPARRGEPADFHPGLPDLTSFPRVAWARSLRTVARELPDAAFGYPDPCGAAALRSALAGYLGRARGVAAEPGRLFVTSGLTQGLALLARALVRRGARRVAVEDPGFFVHRVVLAHAGLEVVPVAVDEHGLRTDLLARVEADAVLVTPAHQAPLGGVLRAARRDALLLWAERRDALVIEDDYDAEYRYDRDPVGAVQGLAPERVAYLGCASKVLSPALRLGWMALPSAWSEPVALEKTLDDLGTPLLDQHAFADFIERGELDRHLRRMHPRYRARRATLVAELARELPEWRVAGVAAGFGVVALPPPQTDERALVAAAARRGLVLHGLADYRVRAGPPGVVLGIGNVTEAALARAVKQIAGAYEEAA